MEKPKAVAVPASPDAPHLHWHDVRADLPREGQCVVATDGRARWFDVYDTQRLAVFDDPWLGSPMIAGGSHRAMPTHWHPTLDLPEVRNAKP